jgi:hypothetical protein
MRMADRHSWQNGGREVYLARSELGPVVFKWYDFGTATNSQ